MNMRVLKPSRKRLHPGDIFVFQVRDGEYRFGRIIRVDAKVGVFTFGGVKLIYIYKATSPDKYSIPELRKEELLIPPVGIVRLPWSRGYFEVVAHRPLEEGDAWPRHCFYDVTSYRDEYGNKISRLEVWRMKLRGVPCGIWGLGNDYTIDIYISKVLGLPISED